MGGRHRAEYSTGERDNRRIFKFPRMQEKEIREILAASEDSNSLKYVKERSRGIFEFARAREGVIAWNIRICSQRFKRCDRA